MYPIVEMAQVLAVGIFSSLLGAFLAFRLFDILSPYNTWEKIAEAHQAGLFAGLLVLGVTLGSFVFAGLVLG